MSRFALFAAGSIVLAAVLTAIGQLVDADDASDEIGAWLLELAVILVAAAIVFGWAVRRYANTDAASNAALVLAALGALSIVVFWLGLPSVLAGGAALLALGVWDRARELGRQSGKATIALVLAGLTVAVAVLLALFG